MRNCYHRECDSKRGKFKGAFANYDFLAHTVQTVTDTVSELAGASCPASPRQQRLGGPAGQAAVPWDTHTEIIYRVATEYITEGPEADEATELSSSSTSSSPSLATTSPLYLAYSLSWLPAMPFLPTYFSPWIG
jgi:hypothetical protein